MMVQITEEAQAILLELAANYGLDLAVMKLRLVAHPLDMWRLELTNDPWPNDIVVQVGDLRVACDKTVCPNRVKIDHVDDKFATGFICDTM